ncbi:putative amidoligase domain-containing protein [Aneurinibacillus thermoaerophilus]|jgi:hypothetical protein|uniref:putative amidoligase domain-containing protein n=1 Tax=Aneurinibacillus thermoaerophilus TaxID=143495 RepID=UPI002E20BB12|nr:hypothetical protein [Aneurinibacillus thermoaerophilus]
MDCFLLYPNDRQPDAALLVQWKGKSGSVVPSSCPDIILQWDDAGLSCLETYAVVLNGREALHNASQPETKRAMLTAADIPYIHNVSAAKEKDISATIRRYIAIVFQQEIVSLYRSSGRSLWLNHRIREGEDKYREIEVNQKIREIRRVTQYAVQSVYALGLDFAAVYFGVDLRGRIYVLDVAPTFRMTHTLARKFIACVERFCQGYACDAVDITLGADVEFVLRNAEGKAVMASSYLPKEGVVGCDRILLRSDLTHKHLPLAEIRPEPGADARELFRNIYHAMMIGIRKIGSEQIEWVAGGMPLSGYPIGGHVHFGGLPPNSQLLRALDTYLALPVFMIESSRSLLRRPKYGCLGDMRFQFHGGFEYRTLPSWLTSPKVARGVLALSHVIALSYRKLRQLPLLDPEMYRAFYNGDREALAPLLPFLWNDLRLLESYARYESYLEPFAQLVLSRVEWEEFADIRPVWKLPPFHPELTASRAYEHSVL